MTQAFGEFAIAETWSAKMVQAYVGQQGTAIVRMFDADGRETDSYDTMAGIQYDSSDSSVVSVVDEDAEPKDATLMAHAEGQATITCMFDGDPGDGERQITLQSDTIEVVMPPPGQAVTGRFEVTFNQV
jgi:hypothetical protein